MVVQEEGASGLQCGCSKDTSPEATAARGVMSLSRCSASTAGLDV